MAIRTIPSSLSHSLSSIEIDRDKISATIQKIGKLLLNFFSNKDTFEVATWSTLFIAIPYILGISSFVGYFSYLSLFALCVGAGIGKANLKG